MSRRPAWIRSRAGSCGKSSADSARTVGRCCSRSITARSTTSSLRSPHGSSVIRERPMYQLALSRMRELYREPEAVFWVFGFPIVLAFALGLAFRNTGPGKLQVGVVAGSGDSALAATLDSSPRLIATVLDTATARLRLKTGRVALVVVPGDPVVYRYDW